MIFLGVLPQHIHLPGHCHQHGQLEQRCDMQGARELMSPTYWAGLVTFSVSLVAQGTAVPQDKRTPGLTSLRPLLVTLTSELQDE